MAEQATTVEEVCDFVRSTQHVRVMGGGSKNNLSREPTLCVGGLSGLIEYQPDEFTFTALAGTPVAQIEEVLAEHGQYLPFDPPLAKSGATLGGTLASGLSGPGRFRYGGVRDFVISCRMVTGAGEIIRGGAKVVKNAAGFDIPKLLVGSLGCFGVLIDLSFKVFPKASATATLKVETGGVSAAVDAMHQLTHQPLDLCALDFDREGVLCLRVGGLAASLPERLQRLRTLLTGLGTIEQVDDDAAIWAAAGEFSWVPPGARLLKIPIVPGSIARIEQSLQNSRIDPPRRYSVGGNVLWLSWRSEDRWEQLPEFELGGLVLRGDAPVRWMGHWQDNVFFQRLKTIFDPDGKF